MLQTNENVCVITYCVVCVLCVCVHREGTRKKRIKTGQMSTETLIMERMGILVLFHKPEIANLKEITNSKKKERGRQNKHSRQPKMPTRKSGSIDLQIVQKMESKECGSIQVQILAQRLMQSF